VLSQQDNLQAFADIDFVHLPDFRRRREFCTVVEKRRGEEVVARRPLDADLATRDVRSSGTETYIEGVLLSALWVRSIMIHPDPARFHAHLRDYLSFIEGYAARERLPADLLPNNIVVDQAGSYRVFDQEWRGEEGIDTDYLLFRALITFANHYRPAIRQFARHYEIHTVGGFIRHAFRMLGRGDRVPEMYCELEDAFQNRIQLSRQYSTAELLEMPIMENPVRAAFHTRLGWTAGDRFEDTDERSLVLHPSAEPAVLRFPMPSGTADIRQLRFRPFDENRPFDSGFFSVDDISITAGSDDDTRVIWSLGDSNAVLGAARLTGLTVVEAEGERVLAASGDEPAMMFAPDLSTEDTGGRPLVVTVTVHYRPCREYQLARSEFLVKNADLEQRVESLEQALRHARKTKADLDRITRSRTWRWISALRRAMPGGGRRS
jgi:hypothetical protein